MPAYSIEFYNQSMEDWDFCVFQQDPQLFIPDVQSLVWFAKHANAGAKLSHTWSLDYAFCWGSAADLVPGFIFEPAQYLTAAPAGENQVTLDYNGVFQFTGMSHADPPGYLFLRQNANIPPHQAAVGIGMSGAVTFVVAAQPNIALSFTLNPHYYVAIDRFQQGQVLDLQEMTRAMEVTFPPDVYVMYATLNIDHTWTISATPPNP